MNTLVTKKRKRSSNAETHYNPTGTKLSSRRAIFGDSDDDNESCDYEDTELNSKILDTLQVRIEESVFIEKVNSNELGSLSPPSSPSSYIFRLFAHTPARPIHLQPTIIHSLLNVPRYTDEIFDPDADLQLFQHLQEAVITFEEIKQQSKIPWERMFFAHKVVTVPYVKTGRRRKRKSGKKRKFDKAVMEGRIIAPVKTRSKIRWKE